VQRYIARRVLWLVVVLLGTSAITFSFVYVLPGDPARAIAGSRVSGDVLAKIRAEWGLDKPLHEQYLDYMGRLFRGDLGHSYYFKVDVLPAIVAHLPATAQLAAAGLLVALLVGIPAGIITAVRQYSWMDRSVMIVSLLGITLPAFLVGLLLLYFFAYRLSLFPLGGHGSIRHLILPAATLGVRSGAWYARVLRSTMLDILGEDFIRTARAKGLPQRLTIGRHALRNALGPLVTMVGADMGYYLGGVFVVEKVFGWPGIGLQAWNAIAFRDIPMIMATVLFGSFFVVLANLVVDIAQAAIDPRIRYRSAYPLSVAAFVLGEGAQASFL